MSQPLSSRASSIGRSTASPFAHPSQECSRNFAAGGAASPRAAGVMPPLNPEDVFRDKDFLDKRSAAVNEIQKNNYSALFDALLFAHTHLDSNPQRIKNLINCINFLTILGRKEAKDVSDRIDLITNIVLYMRNSLLNISSTDNSLQNFAYNIFLLCLHRSRAQSTGLNNEFLTKSAKDLIATLQRKCNSFTPDRLAGPIPQFTCEEINTHFAPNSTNKNPAIGKWLQDNLRCYQDTTAEYINKVLSNPGQTPYREASSPKKLKSTNSSQQQSPAKTPFNVSFASQQNFAASLTPPALPVSREASPLKSFKREDGAKIDKFMGFFLITEYDQDFKDQLSIKIYEDYNSECVNLLKDIDQSSTELVSKNWKSKIAKFVELFPLNADISSKIEELLKQAPAAWSEGKKKPLLDTIRFIYIQKYNTQPNDLLIALIAARLILLFKASKESTPKKKKSECIVA